MDVIRGGAEAALRVAQHGEVFLRLFDDPLTGEADPFVAEITEQFVNQLALGQAALDVGGGGFRQRLQFRQRFVAELVDIDRHRHGCEGRGKRGGSRCGLGVGGRGWWSEGHEKILGEAADLRADDGLWAIIPKDHIGEGHFFPHRELGGEDGFDEGVIESAPGFEPLDLGGAG